MALKDEVLKDGRQHLQKPVVEGSKNMVGGGGRRLMV